MAQFFYTSRHFIGERGRVLPRQPLSGRTRIVADREIDRRRLLATFDTVAFERVGILFGDYICLPGGHLLLDEAGRVIIINADGDSDLALAEEIHGAARALASDPDLPALVARRAALPLYDDIAVVSTVRPQNYRRFTLDLVPKLGLFDSLGPERVLIPADLLEAPARTDLLERAIGLGRVLPLTSPVRLRNPRLAHTHASPETIHRMRARLGLRGRSGRRRIYLRRFRSGRPEGLGGIVEDAAFFDILMRYGFEVVDCGGGERSVAEQIALIDGAGLILAPQGAALANIVHLSPPLTVIEVQAATRPAGHIMLLADMLGFDYVGLVGERDAAGDIAVDAEQLARLLETDQV